MIKSGFTHAQCRVLWDISIEKWFRINVLGVGHPLFLAKLFLRDNAFSVIIIMVIVVCLMVIIYRRIELLCCESAK